MQHFTNPNHFKNKIHDKSRLIPIKQLKIQWRLFAPVPRSIPFLRFVLTRKLTSCIENCCLPQFCIHGDSNLTAFWVHQLFARTPFNCILSTPNFRQNEQEYFQDCLSTLSFVEHLISFVFFRPLFSKDRLPCSGRASNETVNPAKLNYFDTIIIFTVQDTVQMGDIIVNYHYSSVHIIFNLIYK